MTCIDWLADNSSLLLVFSKLAGPTADSGGNTCGTISTVSKPRSLITDAFALIKNFGFHNILVTGANGIKV